MGNIERWWRVIGQNGRSTWLDVDPEAEGMMTGAWHRAEVHGPFVLEATTEGAVSRLHELADMAREAEQNSGKVDATWLRGWAEGVLSYLAEGGQ